MQQQNFNQVMVVKERRFFGIPVSQTLIRVVGTDPVMVSNAFGMATQGYYDPNNQSLLEYHGSLAEYGG